METLSITHNGTEYKRTTKRPYTHVAIIEAEGFETVASWHLTEAAALRAGKFHTVKRNSAGKVMYHKGTPIGILVGTRTVVPL